MELEIFDSNEKNVFVADSNFMKLGIQNTILTGNQMVEKNLLKYL